MVKSGIAEPPDRGVLGDVRAGCLYAGTGVQYIDQVEPAAVLVARLSAETQRLL